MTLDDQLALKLKLERIFNREVRSLFNRIRIQYRIGISTGNGVRAQKFAAAWNTLLENHYSRTQRAFTGLVKDDTKAQDDERDDELIAALMAWSLNSSQRVTKELTDTTQNNMDTAMTQARKALQDDGNFQYTQRELAVSAAVILRRKFRGRETAIVSTETQKAAESTKLLGAYSEAGLDPMDAVTRQRVPIKPKATKAWSDDGGPNVRDGHHTGQVASVFIDEPFIVNGQQLMYPGDTSRGATIENIANCHCSVTYTFN
jgi:hypothetical protein